MSEFEKSHYYAYARPLFGMFDLICQNFNQTKIKRLNYENILIAPIFVN